MYDMAYMYIGDVILYLTLGRDDNACLNAPVADNGRPLGKGI